MSDYSINIRNNGIQVGQNTVSLPKENIGTQKGLFDVNGFEFGADELNPFKSVNTDINNEIKINNQKEDNEVGSKLDKKEDNILEQDSNLNVNDDIKSNLTKPTEDIESEVIKPKKEEIKQQQDKIIHPDATKSNSPVQNLREMLGPQETSDIKPSIVSNINPTTNDVFNLRVALRR